MIFSSFSFILAFLPIVVLGYYLCQRVAGQLTAQFWLIIASFYFYAQWNADYLLILILSIIVNYLLSQPIAHLPRPAAKYFLIFGIIFNLGLLGYFKYTNFIIDSFNQLTHNDFFVQHILLPLAISFFTFQQIAYLVDNYTAQKKPESGFLRYCLFVSFFPQLIAGPIVHHREMMPQFKQRDTSVENIAKGLAIFTIGLFKKVVLADTLAIWVNTGFSQATSMTTIDAWLTSFCYTFQLYFDFSGYADMAIGAALLFNIILPFNFHSPYRSLSIQTFWRNWHMTLSRWLREYVYFPLGGSRLGQLCTLRNLIIVALLSGLWHGAGWTFIIWGGMHAMALVLNRLWQYYARPLPVIIAWFITFLFINISWVMFRAETVAQAVQIYQAMFTFSNAEIGNMVLAEFRHISTSVQQIDWYLLFSDLTDNAFLQWLTLMVSLLVCLLLPNSQQLIGVRTTAKMNISNLAPTIMITIMAIMALTLLSLGNYSEFIYFNF